MAEILKCFIQMKATEQYFVVVLIMTLYEVSLWLKSLSVSFK